MVREGGEDLCKIHISFTSASGNIFSGSVRCIMIVMNREYYLDELVSVHRLEVLLLLSAFWEGSR